MESIATQGGSDEQLTNFWHKLCHFETPPIIKNKGLDESNWHVIHSHVVSCRFIARRCYEIGGDVSSHSNPIT